MNQTNPMANTKPMVLAHKRWNHSQKKMNLKSETENQSGITVLGGLFVFSEFG